MKIFEEQKWFKKMDERIFLRHTIIFEGQTWFLEGWRFLHFLWHRLFPYVAAQFVHAWSLQWRLQKKSCVVFYSPRAQYLRNWICSLTRDLKYLRIYDVGLSHRNHALQKRTIELSASVWRTLHHAPHQQQQYKQKTSVIHSQHLKFMLWWPVLAKHIDQLRLDR